MPASYVQLLEKDGYRLCYPLSRVGKGLLTRTPSPNILWISCPRLKSEISVLEAKGMISEFEAKLRDNEEAQKQLTRQHEAYMHLRWSLLTEEDRDFVHAQRSHFQQAFATGIGGITQWKHVGTSTGLKCLHAHYAHYLYNQDNLCGLWVHEALACEQVKSAQMKLARASLWQNSNGFS